jgi:hypothetical protein
MKLFWTKSLYSQFEEVFQCIVTFHQGALDNPDGLRSPITWDVYKRESLRFANFLLTREIHNLFDTEAICNAMANFLQEKLDYCVKNRQSRQTFKTTIAAMGKLQFAINTYIEKRSLEASPLDVKSLRMEFYARSKVLLRKSSRKYFDRAYPNPVLLIQTIRKGTYQLQAALQYEGGLRSNGTGAPRCQQFASPLTSKALRGIGIDPITGLAAGLVTSIEKNGEEMIHFISVETYRRLEIYIKIYGKLESNYSAYVVAINQAARETGQYAVGRGSHGLTENFTRRRYLECVSRGMSHEQAKQQTYMETSHFRIRENLTSTRGPKMNVNDELELITGLSEKDRKKIFTWVATLQVSVIADIFQDAENKECQIKAEHPELQEKVVKYCAFIQATRKAGWNTFHGKGFQMADDKQYDDFVHERGIAVAKLASKGRTPVLRKKILRFWDEIKAFKAEGLGFRPIVEHLLKKRKLKASASYLKMLWKEIEENY